MAQPTDDNSPIRRPRSVRAWAVGLTSAAVVAIAAVAAPVISSLFPDRADSLPSDSNQSNDQNKGVGARLDTNDPMVIELEESMGATRVGPDDFSVAPGERESEIGIQATDSGKLRAVTVTAVGGPNSRDIVREAPRLGIGIFSNDDVTPALVLDEVPDASSGEFKTSELGDITAVAGFSTEVDPADCAPNKTVVAWGVNRDGSIVGPTQERCTDLGF